MIVIVDYAMGNIASIANMLKKAGAQAVVTSDPGAIRDAEKIILKTNLPCEIRTCHMDDLPRVAQLETRVWRELAASTEEIRRRFNLFPKSFVVAAAGAEILGFCCAVLTDLDPLDPRNLNETFPPKHVPRGPYFFIFGLTVNPVFRRLGIGDSLVRRELAVAARLGVERIHLIANTNSRPLFIKHGFITLRPVALFAGYPELMPSPVLMELRLRVQ